MTTPPKPNPLLEIAVTIVVPGLLLMQFSGKNGLGSGPALVLALAFPLGWGAWDYWRRRQLNLLAGFGLVSTLLTGGIGLMRLDAHWFAVKEAVVPALMGLVIAGSAWTRHPLIHALVFDAALLDTERLQAALATRGKAAAFERRLQAGTVVLGAVFAATAVASYLLARWIVVSPSGTEAFNQELGRLTLLSYGVVSVPTLLLLMGLLFWLAAQARHLSGLSYDELFRPPR